MCNFCITVAKIVKEMYRKEDNCIRVKVLLQPLHEDFTAGREKGERRKSYDNWM